MTITEIQEELGKLIAAMVEKGVSRPEADFDIKSERLSIYLASYENFKIKNDQTCAFCRGDTPEDCFAEAWKVIDAIPAHEEVVHREYLTRVASAIDYATEHSLPDEYVAPLRGVSAAMTDNLLTKD